MPGNPQQRRWMTSAHPIRSTLRTFVSNNRAMERVVVSAHLGASRPGRCRVVAFRELVLSFQGKPNGGRSASANHRSSASVAAASRCAQTIEWTERVGRLEIMQFELKRRQMASRCSVEYGSSTVAIGVCRDDALHHLDECGLFPFTQIIERGAVRGPCRCLDFR